ncbi:MAG: DUF4175 family protein, partial [Bradymonadia bacterium]
MATILDAGLLCILALILTQTAIHFELFALPLNQLLILAFITTVASLVFQLIGIIRRSATDEAVTKLWSNEEDVRTSELILSALELSSQRSSSKLTETTQTLIEHQLDYVLAELSSPEHSPNMPIIWTRRRGVLLGTVMCLLAASLTATNFWTSETGPARTQLSRSWVKGLKLVLEPPAYTKLPSRILENTDGNIETLLGSKVSGEAFADIPPAGQLVLVLPDGTKKILQPSKGKINFSFDINQSGKWGFEVKNEADDEPVKEQIARQVSALVDQVPKVLVTQPTKDQQVGASVLLQFVFSASDDFGLTQSNLVVALDGDLEQAERVKIADLRSKKTRGAEELDLSLFDVQGGDRVAVFIECVDGRQPDPQIGRSKAIYLTIESTDDAHEELTLELKALIEPFLTDLADRLEYPASGRQMDTLAELNKRGTQTLAKAGTLIDKLEVDPLTPKELLTLVKKAFVALAERYSAEEQRLRAWRANPARAVRFPLTIFADIVEKTETMIITLEAAVARLSLEDMKALTEQIRVRRERIKDLLRNYKDNPSSALKSRILRNIKRLKQKMDQLRQKLAQLRQKLPEEFLNLEGLKGSELSETMSDGEQKLDDLEKMLDEGRIEDAMKTLDELSDSLDAFDDLLTKDMETLHREGDPKRQQAVSELMDKTKDLMKQQQALLDETRKTAKKGQEAFDRAIEQPDGRPLDDIASTLVEVERTVNAQRAKEQPSRRQKQLTKLAEEAGKVLDALEAKDLPRSIDNIEKAMEASRRLTWDRQSPDHKTDKRVNRQIEQARKDLKELLSKARQAQQQAHDQAQTDNLSERQKSLKNKLEQLGQELRQKGKEMPGLDTQSQKAFEESALSMDKARQSLDNKRPGQAPPSQVEAMNGLKQAMQDLRNAAKPKPANRSRSSREHQEKVEIPSGEDFEAPTEFREELLKAMKR